jgi:putative membrane protein (TIGR04086 family)
MVNVYRSLRFGVLWGLVALVLALLMIFLAPVFAPIASALEQVGLNLTWFAIMMAGVHFGARSGYRGWLASIFGGGIAGFIAAIFLVLVNYLFAGVTFDVGGSLITLAIAFVVGMFGGFAGEFIDRQG